MVMDTPLNNSPVIVVNSTTPTGQTVLVVNSTPNTNQPVLITEGGRVGPAGPKGDAGSPGEKGEPGGSSISKLAATALSGHRVLLVNNSGLAEYASNANLADALRLVGLSTHAVMTGEPVLIAVYGDVTEPSWNWNTTQPVYLSENGLLTQIPPSAPSAKFTVVVGFPVSPTTLFINFSTPITLTT